MSCKIWINSLSPAGGELPTCDASTPTHHPTAFSCSIALAMKYGAGSNQLDPRNSVRYALGDTRGSSPSGKAKPIYCTPATQHASCAPRGGRQQTDFGRIGLATGRCAAPCALARQPRAPRPPPPAAAVRPQLHFRSHGAAVSVAQSASAQQICADLYDRRRKHPWMTARIQTDA